MFNASSILARYAPIDVRTPINWQHSLNRSRIAWWLAVPGLTGGKYLYDLCGPNHGTLTNMTSTGGWRGTTRPGGRGHLLFDGADDFVRRDTATYTAASFAFSFNTASTVNAASSFFGPLDLKAGASNTYVGFGPTTSLLTGEYVTLVADATSARTGVCDGGSISPGWHRLMFAWGGSSYAIYLDGVPKVTTASASGHVPLQTACNLILAGGLDNAGVVGNFYAGQLDDVTIWSRALSAAEVKADYDLSRAGYPGELNRVSLDLPRSSVKTSYFYRLLGVAA